MANRVTWAPSPDTNIASYSVARGPAAIGPWTPLATIVHDTNDPTVFDSATGKFYYVDAAGGPTDWYRLIAKDSFNQESQPGYFQAAPAPAATTLTATASKDIVGSEDERATGGVASFDRYEPILTVDQLKKRFLFGIPLVAAIPDPVTGLRARMSDDDLKDHIEDAISRIEMEGSFHVTPMEFTVRLPFDRNEYASLGFFRVKDAPVLKVLSLEVKTADSQSVYTVPTTWVDPGQFQKGQINIIPLMPATFGGAVPSFSAGGAAWLSILGQFGWVASYWHLKYVAGFAEGHIPRWLNELIGVQAAIFVLEALAATNRVGSYSLNLDSAGQSVQTGGPNLYDGPLEKLQLRKKELLQKAKAKLGRKFFVENV